jgi:hypothetical protein
MSGIAGVCARTAKVALLSVAFGGIFLSATALAQSASQPSAGRTRPLIVLPGTPVGGAPPPAPSPSPAATPAPSPKGGIARFSAPVLSDSTPAAPKARPHGRLDTIFYPLGFRHIGALTYREKFQCSSIMIGPRWLLTAANCVVSRKCNKWAEGG